MERRKTRSSGKTPPPTSRSRLPRSTSRGRKPTEEKSSGQKDETGKRKYNRSSRSRSKSPSRQSTRTKSGSVLTKTNSSPTSTLSSKMTSLISPEQSSPAKSSSTITQVGSYKTKNLKSSPSPMKDAVSNLLRFRKKTVSSSTSDAKMSFDDMASSIKGSLLLTDLSLAEKQKNLAANDDPLEGLESSRFSAKLPPNGVFTEKLLPSYASTISPRSLSLKKRPWYRRIFDRKVVLAIIFGILLMAIFLLAYFKRDEIYVLCENFILHVQAVCKQMKMKLDELSSPPPPIHTS